MLSYLGLPPFGEWVWPVQLLAIYVAFRLALRAFRIGFRVLRWAAGWPIRSFALWRLKRRSPYGRARWATLSDLRAAKLLQRGGLFLGQWRGWFRRADLFRNGEGHLLTIAGSGAGKTTGLVIPALLEGREGSFIVIDPKAQLAAMTARYRATLGPVVFINPFADELQQQTGVSLPDTGFNPLSLLSKGYNLPDDAARLARHLMVTDRQDSNSYWNNESTALLAVFMVWQILREPPEHQTLTFLWKMVREAPEAVKQRFEWMQTVKESPYLIGEAQRLMALVDTAAQWQGVISKAQLATQRYAPQTPLGDHTAKNGFDISRLKRENVTVFLMVPTGRIEVASPWLNMLMGVFGTAISRPGEARPVYMLMDEAPALGFLPDLRNHLRVSREAGLRAWIFSQTRSALAAPELYGETGFADIMGLCETRTFFGIGGERTLAAEVSAMVGEKTEVNRNSRDGSGADSMSAVGVPMMRPEEILRLAAGNMVIVRGAMAPIRARLVPYWKRKKWQALVDKNPYRKA